MGDKRRPDGKHQPLADLATRQHGVVSTRQLQGLGYSRAQVARAARGGRLQRLHRGVYAIGHRQLSWHSRCLAAVLASAPALASHSSAGWLWGLLRYAPETIDVTTPTRRHSKQGARLHHARLDQRDWVTCDEIPVTSVARTILDLAAMLRPDRLGPVLERSEELKLFDLETSDELLARVTRHPGSRALREALAAHRPAAIFTRSGLERAFLALVKTAGIPPPSMNYNVAGFEVDAYWEAERFAVELDVFETHGTRAAFERDRLRDEELKLAGVETIRVTGPRLDREPAEVIERVALLLERRRRELRPAAGGAR